MRAPPWFWLILLLGVGVHIWLASHWWSHTVDDAYMSFRYARNLVAGHGLVFNPGERVEGYTNFLWVMLVAGGMKAGLAPELLTRVAGLAATTVLIGLLGAFVYRQTSSWAATGVGVGLLAVSPPLAVWATAGLETALFALLIGWGLFRMTAALRSGRVAWDGAVTLALATLTRPEGIAIALATLALVALLGRRQPRSGRASLTAGALVLAVFIPYFVWRWNYYGELLPNTFYAKVDVGGEQWRRGLLYTYHFWRDTGVWLLALLPGAWFAQDRRPALVLAVILGLFSAYIVYVGGDGLILYRFFVPLLAPLCALFAIGAAGWLACAGPPSDRTQLVMLGTLIAAGWTLRGNYFGAAHEIAVQDAVEVRVWREIGLWFRAHAQPDETLAVVPAGAMPYFSGLPTLDLLGLNDATIARTAVQTQRILQAGHEKYNVEYVLARAPTFVLLAVYRTTREPRTLAQHEYFVHYPVERALWNSPAFRAAYRYECVQTRVGWFGCWVRADRAPIGTPPP